MKIIVATTNKHKLREIRHILRARIEGCGVRVKETGKIFEENAIKKAKAVARRDGGVAIADDSGLEVKCLNGKPGVKSARFAGPNPTSQKLCQKLLKAMKNCSDRSAQFVCVIAVVYPDGKAETVRGVCRGKIIFEMRGIYGFGYDPVFVPVGYKKTFAEMKPSMKNKLSHRGKALRKLKTLLKAL